jgi:hypothetical protein
LLLNVLHKVTDRFNLNSFERSILALALLPNSLKSLHIPGIVIQPKKGATTLGQVSLPSLPAMPLGEIAFWGLPKT